MKAILYKDFLVAGRRWQTYLWRTIAVAIPGGIVLLLYWTFLRYMGSTSAEYVAQVGYILTLYTFVLIFILALLGAPTAVIRGVMDERERRTMDLLVASPLGPWSAVMGKTLAALARTGTALLGITPVLFVVYSLGGTEARSVVSALAYLAAGAILAGAVALGVLVTRLRSSLVLILTHVIVLGHLVITLILSGWFGTSSTPWALRLILSFNPFHGCASVLARPLGGAGPVVPMGPWTTLGCASALLLLASMGLAWRRGRSGDWTRGRKGMGPIRRTKMGSRPIYWYEREVRLRSRLRRRIAILVIGIFLTYLGILALSVGVGARWPAVWSIYMTGQVTLFVVFLGATVGGAWTGGNPRSESPILAAPVSMRHVASEKITAVVMRLLPWLGIVAVLFAIPCATHPRFTRDHPEPLAWVPVLIIVMTSALLGLVGLSGLGALMARITGSAARGTGATLAIFLGTAAILPMLVTLLDLDWDSWMVLMGATNPSVLAIWVPDTPADEVMLRALAAVFLEAIVVAAILWITLRAWEPLSRRRA